MMDEPTAQCRSCLRIYPAMKGGPPTYAYCSTCFAEKVSLPGMIKAAVEGRSARALRVPGWPKQQARPNPYPTGPRSYEQMIADFWRIYHGMPEPEAVAAQERLRADKPKKGKPQMPLFGGKK